ncbi:hypothetical protein BHS30_28680 [Klebsiella pneumoniae]|nr:hypothetical protein BHS30_28680 [Klebsiella pneumoniae]
MLRWVPTQLMAPAEMNDAAGFPQGRVPFAAGDDWAAVAAVVPCLRVKGDRLGAGLLGRARDSRVRDKTSRWAQMLHGL